MDQDTYPCSNLYFLRTKLSMLLLGGPYVYNMLNIHAYGKAISFVSIHVNRQHMSGLSHFYMYSLSDNVITVFNKQKRLLVNHLIQFCAFFFLETCLRLCLFKKQKTCTVYVSIELQKHEWKFGRTRNASRRRVFPQLFRVLSNFYGCFY